jgi:hypothetical protein
MKTRNGFVSNSSSSSFILKKIDFTDKQLNLVRDHVQEVQRKRFNLLEKEKEYGTCFDKSWAWEIEENDEWMTGHTSLDNFDMEAYMEIENLNVSKVGFYEYEYKLKDLVEHHSKLEEKRKHEIPKRFRK